jgi:ribosomal protein S18 acetylase RimI-like enzyme
VPSWNGLRAVTDAGEVAVRERRAGDLPEVLEALWLVHETDRYPLRWPDDPLAWLVPARQRRGWVAVVSQSGSREIAGHVAIDASAGDAAIGVASETTRLPVDRLAVVARAFVVPRHRRRGIGSALITTAAESARAEGLRAVLNVLESDRAAIALYERLGWQRTGWVKLVSRHGEPLPSYVYASPGSTAPVSEQASRQVAPRPPSPTDSRCS